MALLGHSTMKMIAIFNVLLMQSLLLMTVEGMEHFMSPFPEVYGCLEKKNVTVFAAGTVNPTQLYKLSTLFNHLQNSCTDLFVFFHNLRKVFRWSDNLRNQFESDYPKRVGETETVEFIEDLQDRHFTAKQILLFFYPTSVYSIYFYFGRYVSNKLHMLDAERNWNVIIVCSSAKLCPKNYPNPIIPINRIVPIPISTSSLKSLLNSLIDNPDFDRLELLKHIKLDDKRLKCLKNKTIYVVESYSATTKGFEHSTIITYKIMEDITLLLHNTEDLHTKFVVQLEFFAGSYSNWKDLTEERLSNKRFKIRWAPDLWERPEESGILDSWNRTTDDVYLFDGVTNTIDYCTRGFKGRESAVFYVHSSSRDSLVQYFYQFCRDEYERIFVKKPNRFEDGSFENWVEDVLSVACP